MFDKMLVITTGLDADLRRDIVEAFGETDIPLELSPLKEQDLDSNVNDVCKQCLSGRDPNGLGAQTPWSMVFLAAFPRSRIDDFIRAVKQVVEARSVFASLTPTNSEWSWRYLLTHLTEEHDQVVKMEREN